MTESQCQRCEVLGGKGSPCVPRHYLPLRELADEDGNVTRPERPCPRVELLSANGPLVDLAWQLLSGDGALVPLMFDARYRDASGDTRDRALTRLMAATQAKQVQDALRAAIEVETKKSG